MLDDSKLKKLKSDAYKIFERGFMEFIDFHVDDQGLYELKEYTDNATKNGFAWSVEKAKAILSVLQSRCEVNAQEILSYLEQSSCGWQGSTYRLYNSCIRFDQRCRRNSGIDNSPEVTANAFKDIDRIFLHKKCGAITTYLFGYSLAALFSSLLKKQDRFVPYFLQIACKRNSNVYRLVHEIVHICDVNTGLFKNCYEFKYAECSHDHMTLYPSGSADKELGSILYYNDIPIIIDGYENEKLYISLLRETANILGKTKRLDLKDKFNVLPIFLCPEIQSQFQNVFSMDLTGLEIEDEYIDLILRNKQRLGSWALELVNNVESYFDAGNSSAYASRPDIQKIIESRKFGNKIPLLYDLDDFMNLLRTKHVRHEKLTSKDITNVAYLIYFFLHYMKVFERSIHLSEGVKFTYRTHCETHNRSELIANIVKEATDSLFMLHSTFAPTKPESINIEIESSDAAKAKRIKEKGTAYAKDIVKYYKSYGVSIRILPNAEYKDKRYIFSVKLIPGTDEKLIRRYAEEVRRIMEIEVLMTDITPAEIKLIVSEEPLKENSLIKILESDQFKKGKMEIPYAIGYDIMGEMVVADVAEFPHLLIGGVTNSGKSSAIHSLLMSIVYEQPPDKVKLLLLDFGASGLKMFDRVPHMLQPTVRTSEIEKGRRCILWLQKEVENRLKKKDSMDERAFNAECKKWPSIVCVIDEFPAFIRQLTTGRGNKKSNIVIEDLLARARKVKVHLVLAAQDTTKDGLGIKRTNLAAGIAFRCTNWQTSKAIIDASEATKLFGKGSMYFKCDQHEGIRWVQGSYMPPEEILDMLDAMDFTKNGDGKKYDNVGLQIEASREKAQSGFAITDDSEIEENSDEQLLLEIAEWIRDSEKDKISNKQLKDNFEMGYDRANRFLLRLEEAEIISKQKKGTKLPRSVNLDKLREFLDEYGDTDHIIEAIPEQNLDAFDMQVHKEPVQEQNIESVDEAIPNIPEHADDVSTDMPQLDPKQLSERLKKLIMERKGEYPPKRYGKKPTR